MLTSEEITRYSRNILLPQVRRAGQEKLQTATVTVVGAGGIGGPVLLYLAAAGVGTIRCLDSDELDLTNLQRQILFDTNGIGKSKVVLASDRIRALNPHIKLEFQKERLTEKNADAWISGSDVAIETSDNFPTKFLVNDTCVRLGVPFILGGILQFEGQYMRVDPGDSGCYRCLFQQPPEEGTVPSCSAAGVIGALAGVIGAAMAGEAVKKILGLGSAGSLHVFDMLSSEWRRISFKRRESCPVCQIRRANQP